MTEVGIAEAQSRFTKLLSEPVTIVDRKTHTKRAVMLPYIVYEELLKAQRKSKVFEPDEELDAFVGILTDKAEPTEGDERYRAIMR